MSWAYVFELIQNIMITQTGIPNLAIKEVFMIGVAFFFLYLAVALHLHLADAESSPVSDLSGPSPGSWTLQGRAQMMAERMLVFNRKNR